MDEYVIENQKYEYDAEGEADTGSRTGGADNNGRNRLNGYIKENELLRQYIDSIKDIKPPSAEEEQNLIRRIKAGDMEAKSELISRNMKLVVHMAFKAYARSKGNNTNIELMDLIQEGNLALTKAVDTYDSDRGARFNTYAGTCVKYAIAAFFRESNAIKPPRDNGYVKLGPKTEIPRVTMSLQELVSNDKSNAGNDETELISLIADPDANTEETIAKQYDIDIVIKNIQELPYRLRHYMSVRWGIADGIVREERDLRSLFNLSSAEIDKLETEAMDELRRSYARVL